MLFSITMMEGIVEADVLVAFRSATYYSNPALILVRVTVHIQYM